MNCKQSFSNLIIIVISAYFVGCTTTLSSADKTNKSEQLNESIKELCFKFNATYAYPQSYKSIYLSPYYDVKVSPDTIEAYLPYYGRAYTAPVNSQEGGVKFVSTKFDYEIHKGKKTGNWLVTIRTKDTHYPYTLFFSLWENGKASLNINHPDRQSISFQGNIESFTKIE